MNKRELIAFLMVLADQAQSVKKEIRAMLVKRDVLDEEDARTIKDLILECISELEVADSDMAEYQRLGFYSKSFVPVKK